MRLWTFPAIRELGFLVMLLVISAMPACNSTPPRNTQSNTNSQTADSNGTQPKNLDEAIARSSKAQIIATHDGGAYVLTDFGVWAIEGFRSFKVKENEPETKHN